MGTAYKSFADRRKEALAHLEERAEAAADVEEEPKVEVKPKPEPKVEAKPKVEVEAHERKAPEPKREPRVIETAASKKAAPAAKKEAAPREAAPAPTTAEIEIDGKKVSVSPEIAAAYKKAEDAQVQLRKDAEKRQERQELVDAVRSAMPAPATPAPAVAAPAPAATIKLPDEALLISDPKRYNLELAEVIARVKAEATRDAVAQSERKRGESTAAAARVALNREFYETYPDFKDVPEMITP